MLVKKAKLYRIEIIRVIIPTLLTVILFLIAFYIIVLPTFEKSLIKQKKGFISNETQTAWSILSYYESKVSSGELTEKEAQYAAITMMRELRYGAEGNNYFWINDTNNIMVMHPYRPDLEGKDLSNFTDPDGRYIFKEFTEIALTHGSGFAYYSWQWDDDQTRIAPKISYIMEFESWGWVVGTGAYVEDIDTEIARITNRLLFFFTVILILISIISFLIIRNGIKEIRKRKIAEDNLRNHKNNLEVIVEKRTNELIELNKTKDRLFSIIAHDLRGPIGSLQGLLDIVENLDIENDHEKIKKIMNMAKESSKDIFELLENLLQWTHSQLDSLLVNIEVINIEDSISKTKKLLELSTKEKSINIIVKLGSNVFAFADKNMIKTVIRNLLSNAIKFSKEKGTIIIEVANENNQCIVSIKDNGVGIKKERLNSLFNFHENKSTVGTAGERGSGLGLVLSHEFIVKNNGKLWVETEEGKGSTFYFSIPLEEKIDIN